MSESRTIPIVGSHFRPPAKALLAGLPAGQELWLKPEPTNEYDQNAVAVLLRTASISESCWEELEVHLAGQGHDRASIEAEALWHIGYIPKSAKNDPEQEAENLEQQLAVARAVSANGDKAIVCSLTFTGDGKPAVIVNPWPPEGSEAEEDTDEELDEDCADCGEHIDDCICEDDE